MFSNTTYQNRRQQLASEIKKGYVLIAGNNPSPPKLQRQSLSFRQDSNFLYFAGIDLPGLNLLIDCSTGKHIIW
jgi:Xaa-Pro aminopeptidase